MTETQTLEILMPSGEVVMEDIPIDQESLRQSFIRVKAQFSINPSYQGLLPRPAVRR